MGLVVCVCYLSTKRLYPTQAEVSHFSLLFRHWRSFELKHSLHTLAHNLIALSAPGSLQRPYNDRHQYCYFVQNLFLPYFKGINIHKPFTLGFWLMTKHSQTLKFASRGAASWQSWWQEKSSKYLGLAVPLSCTSIKGSFAKSFNHGHMSKSKICSQCIDDVNYVHHDPGDVCQLCWARTFAHSILREGLHTNIPQSKT